MASLILFVHSKYPSGSRNTRWWFRLDNRIIIANNISVSYRSLFPLQEVLRSSQNGLLWHFILWGGMLHVVAAVVACQFCLITEFGKLNCVALDHRFLCHRRG